MSRIYFRTQHEGTAELSGRERAWMGMLVRDLAATVLPVFGDGIEPRINPEHGDRFRRGSQIDRANVALWMGHDHLTPTLTDHDGTPLDSFSLQFNTVLALGSDPVALMARLHGQCELHCYVEGPDRAWMADLIDAGQAAKVMRPGQGWHQVAALLRGRDDQPVVCSYSVTEWFPNAYVADWGSIMSVLDDPDPREAALESWGALTDDERWTRALASLRSRPGGALAPAALRAAFDHGRSLFDLFHQPQPVASPA
jgi:hypothetical protein